MCTRVHVYTVHCTCVHCKHNRFLPLQTVVIEAEPVECVVEESDINLNNYAPSMELLKTSGLLQDISNKPSINRLLPPRKKGLRQIVNKLKAKHEGRDSSYYDSHQRVTVSNGEAPASNDLGDDLGSQTQVVHLEPMYETDSGLMQSWRYSEDGETLGQTYRAWQEAEADKKCYKVWPNGKVTSSQEAIKLVNGPDGKLYSVRVPIEDFASVDDLDDIDEEQGYTKYPCPYCKKTFSRIMNVFQHMVKVHDIEMHEAALTLSGPMAETEGAWMDDYLFSLAGPIYAGTNEIQRNIIAERVLGLPGDVRVDKDVPFEKIPTRA